MPRHPSEAINAVIGGNVRRLRKKLDWSQGQLAETVGVTTQQISKYEKGEDQISAPMLVKLSNAFRVVVSELLSGTTSLTAASPGFGETAFRFQDSPRSTLGMKPEEARRALLRIYDELNQPLKDVALRQVQALMHLQADKAAD
jgi:transcriptional regulator with XRE-family HTH domain